MVKQSIIGTAVLAFALLGIAMPVWALQNPRPTVTAQVVLSGITFQPDAITIGLGDQVQWTNQDGLHTVTSDDGLFTSGDPSSDPFEFTHTFTQTGTFKYHCEIHDEVGMVGTVTVEAAAEIYLPQLAKTGGSTQ